MRKFLLAIITLLSINLHSNSQNLTQIVRGTVIDADTKTPMIGVTVILRNGELQSTATNEQGAFKFQNAPVGLVSMQISYVGYEPLSLNNIEVKSGKEVVLELSLKERVEKLEEVVIKANKTKGRAINEMSIVSSRSVSPDETQRYTSSFNDPSKVVANFAGVTFSQNGGSDIIVRGNSPKYMQWRIEGVEITSPFHFDEQNASSGGLSTLNNNLLATSDFYTGAFSPEYGDVLSNVYDIKFRAGNNEKYESSVGVSFLGTDITTEGPFKKGYGGSFLFNYRYSTATVLQDLKLVDVPGKVKFQDAAFNIKLPTPEGCTFTFFGLWGKNNFLLEKVTPQIWSTPSNQVVDANTTEDFGKDADLLNLGMTHLFPINQNSFVKTIFAFSSNDISDDIQKKQLLRIIDANGNFLYDSVVGQHTTFQNDLGRKVYRVSMTYSNKLSAKDKIEVGAKWARFNYDYNQSIFNPKIKEMENVLNLDKGIDVIRSFISWRHRFNDYFTLVSGFHNVNVLYNHKSTIEPRIALNWQLNNTSIISAGFGMHSTMESVPNYFARVKQPDGSFIEPNKSLDLLKARHYVIGYEKRITENMRLKLDLYYQDLYNLPVENNDTSYYSTINEGLSYKYVALVNKGTGKNYGVELTLEKFFTNNYYYLVTASLYNSKYKTLEGLDRNTRFNNNYLFNFLVGKDFVKLGKKQNKTLGINTKFFIVGGQTYIPLLRDNNGGLAVDPANNRYYDFKKAYDKRMQPIYSLNLSVSYKINRQHVTHEFYLDLQNIADERGKLDEYYDANEPGKVGYVTQIFFFPNLMYKVYF